MNRLVERVSEYMQEHHMVENGQKIVVGVSGGADSMALLSVLSELADAFGISLVVVHVNHGIRGKSADADQAYVEKFCADRGIASCSFHIDLNRFAQKEGMSLEEAGRYYRYQCFEKVRKEVNGHKIAVAHHQGDACETILFNMFRGTGLKGLTGILPVRDAIIRPLLCVNRGDIEKYLQQRGISWQTDETNLTDDYSRNKIRHHVIPYIEEHINSASGQHIQEMAELLRDVSDYLDLQSAEAFDTCVRVGENPICVIQAEEFSKLHVVIQREVLRRAIHVAAGKLKDIDKEHVEMVRGLFGKYVGRRCHLPYQLQAVRTYDGVMIKKEMQQADAEDEGMCVDIHGTGVYKVSGRFANVPKIEGVAAGQAGGSKNDGLTISFEMKEDFHMEEIPINRYTKWFDYDTIRNGLSIRTRENGDYIVLDGQGHKKLLKRWMIDEKIPREERDRLLLLADGSHILWIIGYRISDSCKVSASTERVLEVQVRCETDKRRNNQYTIDRERSGYPDLRTG